MISVLRLAPIRKDRLWTSSGRTVRISMRKGIELMSLLYLRGRRHRDTRWVIGQIQVFNSYRVRWWWEYPLFYECVNASFPRSHLKSEVSNRQSQLKRKRFLLWCIHTNTHQPSGYWTPASEPQPLVKKVKLNECFRHLTETISSFETGFQTSWFPSWVKYQKLV